MRRWGNHRQRTGNLLLTVAIYGLFSYLVFSFLSIGVRKCISGEWIFHMSKDTVFRSVAMVGYFAENDKQLLQQPKNSGADRMLLLVSEPAAQYQEKSIAVNVADSSKVTFYLDDRILNGFADETTNAEVQNDNSGVLWANTGNNSGGNILQGNQLFQSVAAQGSQGTGTQGSQGTGTQGSQGTGAQGGHGAEAEVGNGAGEQGNQADNSAEKTGVTSADQPDQTGQNSEPDQTGQNSQNAQGTQPVLGTEIPLHKSREIDPAELTYEYLMKSFYTVVSSTTLRPEDIDAAKLMSMDMHLKTASDRPQILIYHTHGQEGFTDSVSGRPETGIVGVGDYLTKLLTEQYGYNVLHITDSFDYVNGVLDRSKAYDYAYERIAAVLAENPSIEVVIDLHRDGVGEQTHLVTEINGKQTAQIMFFNGISRLNDVGEIGYLYNPYRTENLAMSLQMKVLAEEYFPGFTRRNYIQAYQYNLHMRPKSMLIEAGAQTNSFEEVKNAMEPLAALLHLCIGDA